MMHTKVLTTDTTVVEGSKWCSRCERAKPLSSFYLDRAGKPRAWCRRCRSRYSVERVRHLEGPSRESHRKAAKRYRDKNPGKDAEYKRAWRKTPLGRLRTNLYLVRWRLKKKPSESLRETVTFLLAEIARLEGSE